MTLPFVNSVGPVVGTPGGSNINAVITAPATVGVDDILVLTCLTNSTTTLTSGPSGWSKIGSDTSTNGTNDCTLNIWSKRAVAGDVGASNYSFGLSIADYAEGAIVAVRGCVNSGSPWDTGAGAPAFAHTSVATGTAPAVSLTTQGPDRLLWNGAANQTGGTPWTASSGFTKDFDTTGGGSFSTCTGYHNGQAIAGATGNVQPVCPASGEMVNFLGALLPVSTVGPAEPPPMLPPPLLYELAARNQAMWQNAGSAIQADAGVAEIDQRSTTTNTATKGGQGGGRPSARAVTSCIGIKGGAGTGTATARNTTSNTAAKGATGTGVAAQHSSTTAAKATTPTGTGTATQRTATSSAAVKGGISTGRPSTHVTTSTAGRHQGIATAGIAATHPATQVTAAHGATGTGRPTQHSTTSVTGLQVAAFVPAMVGIDGSATGGSLDSTALGSSTDGTVTATGDLDSLATTSTTDSTTTASGYL